MENSYLSGGAASESSKEEHVPEERTEEQQMAELLERLTGHEQFAKWRGRLGAALPLIMDVLRDTQSPSEAKRRWQEMVGAAASFLMMLTQLDRDGDAVSSKQLQQALLDPDFLFTGEDVPVDQSVSIVLVIPGADITLKMLEQVQKTSTDYFTSMFVWRFDGGMERAFVDPIRSVLEAFPSWTLKPSLRRSFTHAGYAARAPFIKSMHEHDVLSRFPNFIGARLVFDPIGTVATLVEGEQSDVLKQVPRDLQKELGVWQFRVPRIVWDRRDSRYSREGLTVALFDERLHEEARKIEPAYTSRGVSHGLAAMVAPGKDHRFSREAPVEYRRRPFVPGGDIHTILHYHRSPSGLM